MSVNIRRKIQYRWFTYSDGHGAELFETKEETIKYANEMIDAFRDTDGWDDAVSSICMGEITAFAHLKQEPSDGPDSPNWNHYVMRECK